MKDLCDKTWDELYGAEYGISDKCPCEPMYSFFCNGWNKCEEKLKCCGNCGNERCTSKYRGNSAYHRQSDGYACADNEDWIPRKEWPNKCFDCAHWNDDLKLCQFSRGDKDHWCRGRDWETKEEE